MSAYIPARPSLMRLPDVRVFSSRTERGTTRLHHIAGALSGSVSSPLPRPVTAAAAGYLPDNFLWHFYDRMIAIPESLDLGSISSEQVVRVHLWNATFRTQTLRSVLVSGREGITLSGTGLPRAMNRLGMLTWTVTVAMEGPDAINTQLQWMLDGGWHALMKLTGRRSVPWLITPDWSEHVTETLSWKTDVLVSLTGAEQRIARRLSPRRTFEFKALASGNDARQLESSLFHYGSRVWSLPLFTDVSVLDVALPPGSLTLPVVTKGRDFAPGGQVMLASAQPGERNETAEIAEVGESSLTFRRPLRLFWPAGTHLFPVRSAMLTDPATITRKSDNTIAVRVRFRLTGHNAFNIAASLPVYRGFYVIEPGSDWSDDLSMEYQRNVMTFDNDTGVIRVHDFAHRPFGVQRYRSVMRGRDEQAAFRAMLYALRGRQKPVWVGSQSSDFDVIRISGNHITVSATGVSLNGPQPGRRDLRIETGSGTYYVRLTSVIRPDNATEIMVFDGPPLQFTGPEVLKLSWLTLCRLDGDDVAWEHITDADGVAVVDVNFRGVRDELE
ncbi:hypothetical protein AAE121_004887 [Salmonella enterica]